MNLFKTAVARPVATLMIFSGILVMGAYALTKLPVDLFPEIEPPVISVLTTYPGAGPKEVEQNVTEKLEEQLSTVNNLDEITSSSIDNVSSISLEFSFNADLNEAANDIRDVISRVRPELPDGIEEPTIFKFSSSMFPVIILGATADESYTNLRQILDNKLVTPLNRVKGVGGVSLQGGPERAIKVLFDPAKLEAYNLEIDQIGRILAAENVNIPAGDIQIGKLEYNMNINSEFQHIREIKDVILTNVNNKPVYLSDVAEVKDGLKAPDQVSKINGRDGIRISVQKQSDANSLNVANAVNQKVAALKNELPADVAITTIVDTSEFIVSSISDLSKVLIYSLIFVILVVLLFLRRWKATIIVALTIPFSLIAGFIYLSATGQSLNLISLSSLSIALGMVVDDAIVVLENIMKHVEKGNKPRQAAQYGTNEVGVAVVATTLTVIAVFLPLTFITGQMGIWFGQLGWIVVITVSVSTLAALTLIPTLSSLMISKKLNLYNTRLGKLLNNGVEKGLTRIENGYKKAVTWALKHKIATIIIAILIFAGSFGLVNRIGTEFMPENDNGRLEMTIELNTGRSLESTTETLLQLEKLIHNKVPEIENTSASAGTSTSGFDALQAGNSGPHIITFTLNLVPANERNRDVFTVAEKLRNAFDDIPEIVNYSVSTQGGAGGDQSPIAINVFGRDLDQTSKTARDIAAYMKTLKGTRGVDVSRGRERAEFELKLDQSKLSAFGLNTSAVAGNIRNKFSGLIASQYREEGEEYDIELQYKDAFKQSLHNIRNISIPIGQGKKVNFENIGTIHEAYAPPNIEHINRSRAITVSSDLYQSSLTDVVSKVKNHINNEMNIPAEIDITYGGQFEEQQESFADLIFILVLSLILVYIVMAAQFESLKDPFIIMLSIPFAFTGVILALFFTNTKLSVIAFLGGVILTGIVVKNAIVLVDYIKLLRNRGYEMFQAIVASSVSRFRPVLMTTLTTILAMLPLALSSGEGSATWKPMAIAVIGGLSFSTLITLIFVPVMYGVFERKSKNLKNSASLTH